MIPVAFAISWLLLTLYLIVHMFNWFWARIRLFRKPLPMTAWVLFAFVCGQSFSIQMNRFGSIILAQMGIVP